MAVFAPIPSARVSTAAAVKTGPAVSLAPIQDGSAKRPFTPHLAIWWALKDLNLRPTDYESAALTS